MARSIYQFGLCLALATLAAACDDGGTSSGEGGGGRGGGTTTTSDTTTGSTSATTSSQGGGGSGPGGGGSGPGGGGSGPGGGGSGPGGGGSGPGGGGSGPGGSGGGGSGPGGSGGSGGTGGSGGMGPTASEQIAAVRAAADGPGLDLQVQGAFVTYTKPELGMDVAGFFVQAEAAGPAVFVAIDPASLMPSPQVGDELEFTVTEVATSTGLKQVTAITNAAVLTTGNPIGPLVTEVSMAMDLVTNLAAYESRVLQITGDINVNFINAGFPQVATPILTAGLDDPDLRLRMPAAIRDQFSLGAGCNVGVDYGVMWRFNAVAQPSVYSATDLINMTCPLPTVVSAVPLSLTEVVVTFDRTLDAATVDAADFTFDNGLMATAVVVNGAAVTVTTTPETPGLMYTVTVANLTDTLGAPLGMPDMASFTGYVPVAQLVLNEINPNIANSRDLIELLVITGGSTNGVEIRQKGSANELIATLPDVIVATNDLIVVHLNAAAAAGAAPGSELASKTEYPAAMFSANYDGAWDFHGSNTGLTFSNRVMEIDAPGGGHLDGVPVVLSSVAMPPAAFPTVLQALQAEGNWMPADCGGMLCTYATVPTAIEISVDYLGCGTSATGNTVQRKPGLNTKQKSDWNLSAAHSWGLPNP